MTKPTPEPYTEVNNFLVSAVPPTDTVQTQESDDDEKENVPPWDMARRHYPRLHHAVSDVLNGMAQAAHSMLGREEVQQNLHVSRSTLLGSGLMPRQTPQQENQPLATAQPCAVAQGQDIPCVVSGAASATTAWSWKTLRTSSRFDAPQAMSTLQPANWTTHRGSENAFGTYLENGEWTEGEDEDEDEDEGWLM